MKRPGGAALKSPGGFPLAVVSRKPLKAGLAYGMTIQDRPMETPGVPLPVLSSRAQQRLIHRFQLALNTRLIHPYGFAPGNPILQAESTDNRMTGTKQTPTPTMSNFGGTPAPGRPVFPRSAARGRMGSPKRFPKAIQVIPNDYTPSLYGGGQQSYPGQNGN